jgi:mannose-6-phosphate isomerase-like protein (cupin superfamily)
MTGCQSVLVRLTMAVVLVTNSAYTAAQTKSAPPIVVDGAVVEEMRGPGCGTTKFLVNGAQSSGAFALLDSRECQHLTGLHRHNRTDEAFYVIEGRLNVFVNGTVHRLRAGDFIFIPRGTPHAQGNPANTPNHLLLTITPAGFDELLKYRAQLLARMAQSSPEFAAAMAAKQKEYDIEPLGPTPAGLAELR